MDVFQYRMVGERGDGVEIRSDPMEGEEEDLDHLVNDGYAGAPIINRDANVHCAATIREILIDI